MDLTHLQQWIGKSQSSIERIAPFPANALAATLDRDDPLYTENTALPPLWHWLHFLPIFKLENSGYDGHAALGDFLPPVPLPRRMWAGSRLHFHHRLLIGHELRKVSSVQSVEAKSGRTGQLVFVTVRHQIFDGETLGIDEEHDIVYREEPKADAPVRQPPKAPEHADFSREVNPNPVMLFRYSALTFNAHRIHYDQPFCLHSERYQGLVVHGPLLATLLLDLLRCQWPDAQVTNFSFRSVSTVFDNERFSIHGVVGENSNNIALWVKRQDGALAMDAEATLA